MIEVKPTFTVEEAQHIIELLEGEARKGGSRSDWYRGMIAKIQCTTGYLQWSGITNTAGYHLEEIPRGTYGEISKILEEAAELKDAMEQANKVMVIIELSDLVGAIDGYMEKYYGDKLTIDNLITMAFATKRAFTSGHRK